MQLLYCYDALCGWCYGFSPVITDFAARHPEVPVKVISGGMITGPRIGPIGEVAGYIKQAYRVVEDRCGVTFGQQFLTGVLEKGSAVFTSVPPAVAMAAFREVMPGEQLPYAAAVQRAIYYAGMEPKSLAGYADLAAEFGVPRVEFLDKLSEPGYREMAEADFERTAQLGVTGFPTVIAQHDDGRLAVLARGYVPPARLEAAWQSVVGAGIAP